MQRSHPSSRRPATRSAQAAPPFWERKQLHEFSQREWESLCDGCGRCCLLKFEDEDTGEIHLSRLACRLLDLESCRCRDYTNRSAMVPDCISLNPDAVEKLSWLPPTCGYRRIADGRGLAWWHPLVSGDPATVHAAGISVAGWAVPESAAADVDPAVYIIDDWHDA